MNNDAFKEMVRNRGPSTKDIARAAVEAEFRKRGKGRKRKGGDDYLSDSDDGDRRPQRPKKETSSSANRAVLFRPTQVKVSEEEDSNYRDRAKERREGGSTANLTSSDADGRNDAEMPLPVATKGLDMSLVRKEKLQLRVGDSSDDDENHPLPATELPSLDQARKNVHEFLEDPFAYPLLSTELAEYVKQYARHLFPKFSSTNHTAVKCGVEGRTLQRTRLVLSMDGHPSDRRRAWEVPRELLQSNAKEYPDVPPLKEEILASLEHFFPSLHTKNSVVDATSSAFTTPDATEVCPPSTSNDAETFKTADRSSKDQMVTNDDDDVDIFGGLEDYVPPAAKSRDA